MYYIYHIPGIKIGISTRPKSRVKVQGYDHFEILETHEDGWLAGNREQELQKQYGYVVDNVHYMISVQNSGIRKMIRNTQHQSNAGRIGGSKGGPARKGVPKSKIECPYCGKIGGCATMKRWHFDNCKKKGA